jgi:hypothetical protein
MGPQGLQGPPGTTNIVRRETPQPNCGGCGSSETFRAGSAPCFPGERLTGGGYALPPGSVAHVSRPTAPSPGDPDSERWEVLMNLPAGYTSDGWSIYALCASP